MEGKVIFYTILGMADGLPLFLLTDVVVVMSAISFLCLYYDKFYLKKSHSEKLKAFPDRHRR